MRIGRMLMTGVAVITLGGAAAFAQGDSPGQGDAPTQADASKPVKSTTESRGGGGSNAAAGAGSGGDSSSAENQAGDAGSSNKDGKARNPNDELWEQDKDCCP